MGRHIGRDILLALCITFASLAGSVAIAAQDATSTPSSSPAAALTPEFGLVPVGDHPEGYFADIEVAGGESVELSVAVVNFGQVPADLKTYKVNALNGPNGGFVSGSETDEPTSLNAWVSYPTQALTLQPGEQQEITFSVAVPTEAQPGQYVSGLVVETVEPLAIPGTESLDQIIGHVISVSVVVPGDRTFAYELGEPEIFMVGTLRTARVPITNTGNYLVRPSGEMVLSTIEGEQILTAPVQLGSVYAGLTTYIEVPLPQQLASGNYVMDLSLSDEASGVAANLDDASIAIPAPGEQAGIAVAAATIMPNDTEVVFANVDVTLGNSGQQIPATNVTLNVMHDGELVEEFPLATNQVLLNGENQFVTRYLPATMWEPGTYTFGIVVSAVDPNGGQETILLDEELDAEIIVP